MKVILLEILDMGYGLLELKLLNFTGTNISLIVLITAITTNMIPLQLVMAFLFCVSSFANSIIDQNELRHVMDELKLLRKEVEQNRKHILKQDGELKAVKLELEEVKKHCRCGSNPSEEKSEPEMNEVSSVNKTAISLSGGQTKISKYLLTLVLPLPSRIEC